MKERPILFNGPMVRAILDGSKTQTRRIAKLSSSLPDGKGWTTLVKPGTHVHLPLVDGRWQWKPAGGDEWQPYPDLSDYCPYGKPGDRLWVRETWTIQDEHPEMRRKPEQGDSFAFRATGQSGYYGPTNKIVRWRPSIHMPRLASRINLEITGVRIERLNNISPSDSLAEGCPYHHKTGFSPEDAVKWYADLWESINGTGSWAANPWVWVVEFKRV